MKIGTRTVHYYVEPATGLLGEIDQATHLDFNSYGGVHKTGTPSGRFK